MDLRQIDVLVHQHVMGADLTGFDWPTGFRDHMVRETRDGDGVRVEWIDIPRYSSDIAAAWQVVEKMQERATYMTVERHPNYWRAVVYDGNWYFELSEHADTAPLAICLAALRTVGVEVPEDS